jgi:hypothetical protein
VVRRGHLIAVVVTFLIGCVVLLAVGCAATRSESPKKGQGHAEVTKEQTRSAKASEEARCAETRVIDLRSSVVPADPDESVPALPAGPDESNWETNDVPGCPKGGPLLGTDSADKLDGGEGDDEIRALGAKDELNGGLGSDVIYGGPGNDFLKGTTWYGSDRATSKDVLYGGPGDDEIGDAPGDDVLYGGDGDDVLIGGGGDDVLYSGDGNDFLIEEGGPRDKLYCGEGKDRYYADKSDYVDSSCEKKSPPGGGA